MIPLDAKKGDVPTKGKMSPSYEDPELSIEVLNHFFAKY